MNAEGKYTDKFGRVLDVGVTVEVVKAEGEQHGTGEVITLPPPGDDWYGFPYVRLHHSGKPHHIAEPNLRLLSDGSLVDRLEQAVEAGKAYNAGLRALIEAARNHQVKVKIEPGTFARRRVEDIEIGEQVLVEYDPDNGLVPVLWTGPDTLWLRSGDEGLPVVIGEPHLVPVTGRLRLSVDADGRDRDREYPETCLETPAGTIIVPDTAVLAVPTT
jgi:hypothetical protein